MYFSFLGIGNDSVLLENSGAVSTSDLKGTASEPTSNEKLKGKVDEKMRAGTKFD